MRYLAVAVALSVAVVGAPVASADVTSGVPPDTPWALRTIVEGAAGSGQFAGSDGVDLADINRDGLPDVVSGYEQGHRVSVSLHPGGAAVRDPWRKTVKLPGTGRILGPEDAVFADVDKDGATDVIVGAEADRRVTILFAPTDPGVDDRNLLDATKWQRVDVAASLAVNMATMRVQWADMNGDGATDILAGGKETSTLPASLGYYTSSNPRDGGSWTYHSLTPAGWVMQMLPVDMNNDGRLDIVYSDRDPINVVPPGQPVDGSRRGLRWLRNPGGSSLDWTAQPISPVEPLHKWFSIVDWDADRDLDVVDCRSEANVHQTAIWLNRGDSLAWTKVVVPIPARVGWCQHATVADVDGTGGKDLAFSYSHAGDVSGDDDLSGVVWLKNTGTPGAPSWERHEIGGPRPGIKYDNLVWTDLDRDGDLDALTSEQHEDTDDNDVLGPGLGVIWYENPETNRTGGVASVFNVRDFGATGDGVTDDAPAFRSAIAAADGSAAGTVLVPAGTYVVDRMTLNGFGVLNLTGVSDVAIVGDGPSSVIKQRPRDWTAVVNPTLLWCERCDTVSFTDLTLDGSRGDAGSVGKEQMHGIDLRSSTGVRAERVRFQDMYGDGVRVLGAAGAPTENVDIRVCVFVANGRSGISVQGGTRLMTFSGNHFEQISDQDIDFEPTGSDRPPPRDILIEQNTTVRPGALPLSVTIHGKGDAVPTGDRTTKRVRFINNVIDGAISVFNTEDVLVAGNTIVHAGERPTLNVSGVADNTTVRNNTLEYGGGSAPGVVNVARKRTTVSILIELNKIRALAGATGVSLRQDGGPATIRNNELAGSGGGAGVSLDLPVDDGLTVQRVAVSGNAIRAFGVAAVRAHTVGSTRYVTLTLCGNTVSDQPIGIRLQLASATSVGEAEICGNTWRAGVTTPVVTNVATHFRGTGSPEGVISAPVGSEFIRSDEAGRLYRKQSGTGRAGWVAT